MNGPSEPPFHAQGQADLAQHLLQPPALDQVAEAGGADAEGEEAPGAARVAIETQPVGNEADETRAAVTAAAAVSVPTPVLIVLPSTFDSAPAPTDSVEAPPVGPLHHHQQQQQQQHEHAHDASAVPSMSANDAGDSSCSMPSMPAPVPSPLSQPRRISVQLPLTLQLAYKAPQVSDTPPVSEQRAKDLYTRQVHWWQAHRQAVRACVVLCWVHLESHRGACPPYTTSPRVDLTIAATIIQNTGHAPRPGRGQGLGETGGARVHLQATELHGGELSTAARPPAAPPCLPTPRLRAPAHDCPGRCPCGGGSGRGRFAPHLLVPFTAAAAGGG